MLNSLVSLLGLISQIDIVETEYDNLETLDLADALQYAVEGDVEGFQDMYWGTI